MASIANDKPQDLSDSQWLLTWQESSDSDQVYVLLGEDAAGVTESIIAVPASPGSTLDNFMRPDEAHGAFLLDLERIPNSVSFLEFAIEVQSVGNRSWHLEGLNTGESLQNLSVSALPGGQCRILRLERVDEVWHATALALQDMPADSRDESVFVGSDNQPLIESAKKFEVIIDMTASMHPLLDSGLAEAALSALVAKTVAAKLPLSASFHGVATTQIDDPDNVAEAFKQGMTEAVRRILTLQPLHALVPRICADLTQKTELFVITEALFFMDDDIVEELGESDSRLSILLLADDDPTGSLPNSDRVRLVRLTADPAVTADQLLEMF